MTPTTRRFLQYASFRSTKRGEAALKVLLDALGVAPALNRRLQSLQDPYIKLLGPPAFRSLTAPSRVFEGSFEKRALLPPLAVPSSVLFRHTTVPFVRGRPLPSGLDLLVVGPMATPAGKEIFRRTFPAHANAVLVAPQPALAKSVLADALVVLRELALPVAENAPAMLQTRAWREKQCGTQLAAWAELRIAAQLHGHCNAVLVGVDNTVRPPHRISPYPVFFRKLGDLALATAKSTLEANAALPFDPATAGRSLAGEMAVGRPTEAARRVGGRIERFLSVAEPEFTVERVRALIHKAAAGHPLTAAEVGVMKRIAVGGDSAADRLIRFGMLCRRLSGIASRQLAGKLDSSEDQSILESIGETLGRLVGYIGNTWYLRPRDDAAEVVVVTKRGDITPLEVRQPYLHVGVARPRLLYIVLPFRSVNTLYQGAVSTYRELYSDREVMQGEWRRVCDAVKPAFLIGE